MRSLQIIDQFLNENQKSENLTKLNAQTNMHMYFMNIVEQIEFFVKIKETILTRVKIASELWIGHYNIEIIRV